MIIEVFLLNDDHSKPESIHVELTPETIAEEKSLRNAKVLHKNSIMVYWGDTLEIGNITGSIAHKSEKEEVVCMDGLKINFKLPKSDCQRPE